MMETEKADKAKQIEGVNEKAGGKKQVRRRFQSSKAYNYKERFVNMAEARREIATALKFHRASMNMKQQQHANTDYYHHTFPPPPHHEDLNLALPNQTLGLNLNFQDFNNLNTTSIYSKEGEGEGEEGLKLEIGKVGPFEQVMEFPPWLMNANESCCFCCDEYSPGPDPDPPLPCMDIGEFQGTDGEWLG